MTCDGSATESRSPISEQGTEDGGRRTPLVVCVFARVAAWTQCMAAAGLRGSVVNGSFGDFVEEESSYCDSASPLIGGATGGRRAGCLHGIHQRLLDPSDWLASRSGSDAPLCSCFLYSQSSDSL